MKLQSISLIAAICLVATAAASPVPKEEKRVAKPHNDKRAPRHIKRNALGKRGEYEDKYDYDDYYYSEYDDYYYDSYDSYDYDDYYYSDYDDYSYGKKGYKRNAAPKPVPHKKRDAYDYYEEYDYDDYYYEDYDDYYYEDSYDYDDYYYDDYSYGKKGYKRNAAPKPVPHNKRGGYSDYYDSYDYDDYYYSEYDDYYYEDSYDYDDYYYSDYDDYSYGKKGYKRNAAPHSQKRAAKHQ